MVEPEQQQVYEHASNNASSSAQQRGRTRGVGVGEHWSKRFTTLDSNCFPFEGRATFRVYYTDKGGRIEFNTGEYHKKIGQPILGATERHAAAPALQHTAQPWAGAASAPSGGTRVAGPAPNS